MNRPMKRVETLDEIFRAGEVPGVPQEIVYHITRVVDSKDNPHGQAIRYNCPNGLGSVCGVPMVAAGEAVPPTMGTHWQYDGNADKPTLTPSIQCLRKECMWHGYVTAGELVTL